MKVRVAAVRSGEDEADSSPRLVTNETFGEATTDLGGGKAKCPAHIVTFSPSASLPSARAFEEGESLPH